MNPNQHFSLRAEYGSVIDKIFELWDSIDALHILRTYTPNRKRHLLDRLETQLKLKEEIDNRLEESDLCAFFSEDDDHDDVA
jgi:hypothetical protein